MRARETPHALLSRGLAGLRGTTLVVNLPGSPGGCRDGFAVLQPALVHGLELAAGDQASPTPLRHERAALSLPRRFASLVKLEHTVFALPFAYVGASSPSTAFPARRTRLDHARDGRRADARDGPEPARRRGARRPQPAHGRPRDPGRGAVAGRRCGRLCAVALALYLVAVFQLEPIVRWLWPIPVVMFVVYPYLKRVTWLCHLWLGACTGLAPLGAWLAVTG